MTMDLKTAAQRSAILQAVAHGWCHPSTSGIEMDSRLAEAITDEVLALFASSAASQGEPDVDALAQEIRRVDGNHSLGAGALAEKLVEWMRSPSASERQQGGNLGDKPIHCAYVGGVCASDCDVGHCVERVESAHEVPHLYQHALGELKLLGYTVEDGELMPPPDGIPVRQSVAKPNPAPAATRAGEGWEPLLNTDGSISMLPNKAASDACDAAQSTYWRNLNGAPIDHLGGFRAGWFAHAAHVDGPAAQPPQAPPAAPSAEQGEGMTAKRAAYFMERFQREEKMLGPNEQAAINFVLALLATEPAAPVGKEVKP